TFVSTKVSKTIVIRKTRQPPSFKRFSPRNIIDYLESCLKQLRMTLTCIQLRGKPPLLSKRTQCETRPYRSTKIYRFCQLLGKKTYPRGTLSRQDQAAFCCHAYHGTGGFCGLFQPVHVLMVLLAYPVFT